MNKQGRIRNLKYGVKGFMLVLFVLAAYLFISALEQLKWQAIYQNSKLAQDLVQRVNSHLLQQLNDESERSFTDYQFLVSSRGQQYSKQSPLAQYPVKSNIGGLLGYFQVDSTGNYSTPLLPDSPSAALEFGVSIKELEDRQALSQILYKILRDNQLASKAVAEAGLGGKRQKEKALRSVVVPKLSMLEERDNLMGFSDDEASAVDSMPLSSTLASSPESIKEETAFDAPFEFNELKNRAIAKREVGAEVYGQVKDLGLKQNVQIDEAQRQDRNELAARKLKKQSQKVKSDSKPIVNKAFEQEPILDSIELALFQSELDSFQFSLLDSGHFIMYREVFQGGKQYFQGSIIEQTAFFEQELVAPYLESSIAAIGNLIISYKGGILKALSTGGVSLYAASNEELKGNLLYEGQLVSPLDDLKLIFSSSDNYSGEELAPLFYTGGLFIIILTLGGLIFIRLGVKQINLTAQQQDFVSSVSHELKTPLTSIRMYGEILKSGWADDEKKQEYYSYIFDESERLSRLISNILQLAKMDRGEIDVSMEECSIEELLDLLQSRVSANCLTAGFQLKVSKNGIGEDTRISVDKDAFVQVIINLVDNAIKFSKDATNKSIEIDVKRDKKTVLISVRDYGSGIEEKELKKVFDLFYRSENEMTRQTSGTGIGLALVKQLLDSMDAKIKLENTHPGVRFDILFRPIK